MLARWKERDELNKFFYPSDLSLPVFESVIEVCDTYLLAVDGRWSEVVVCLSLPKLVILRQIRGAFIGEKHVGL